MKSVTKFILNIQNRQRGRNLERAKKEQWLLGGGGGGGIRGERLLMVMGFLSLVEENTPELDTSDGCTTL